MNSAVQSIVVWKNRNEPVRASSCQACMRRSQCPAASVESGILPAQRIIRAGKAVYEAGERFDGIYIVRSGFLKSYSVDVDGVMQVTGFYLPGESVGMDGIDSGSYADHVEALETSSICKIPLALFQNVPGAAGSVSLLSDSARMLMLVKLMGRALGRDRNLFFTLGKLSARRRIGVFLENLSVRMGKSGYSASEFILCMSRTDIANYLCLALETVSRVVTRLQSEGVIEIDRRHIRLLDMEALVNAQPRTKSAWKLAERSREQASISGRVTSSAARNCSRRL